MKQAPACKRMVKALREADVLRPVHDGLVAAAVGLSEAVDSEPRNASLWREYRAALVSLKELADGFGSDELDDLLARLSAPVRD